MGGKKAFSSGGESKLDSGQKCIGESPLSSRFSGYKVGVEPDEGGNTLGTLDSAGAVELKLKNGFNTWEGVGRGPLVEIGSNKFETLKLGDTGEGVGRGPLVEIGDNKFEKLKLEDTGVGRGPLVEVGGNKFGEHET